MPEVRLFVTGADGPFHWPLALTPGGPYYHGSFAEIALGEELRPDIISGHPSDYGYDTPAVWATTLATAAMWWGSAKLLGSNSGTLFVYEIGLIGQVEIDTNVHQEGDPGPYTSVMAPGGRILRQVHREYIENVHAWRRAFRGDRRH